MTKKAEILRYKEQLKTNDRWAIRGLIVIYQHQTTEEKSSHQTVENNGVGFNGFDADFASSLAEQYKQKGYLSPNQLTRLHRIMPKYAGQLYSVAQEKTACSQLGLQL